MNKFQKVITENPETEQWRLLSQFSYPANVTRFLQEKGFTSSDDLVEAVTSCIRHGDAYYRAYINAPLDISPLLLYYGTVNLFRGVSILLMGQLPNIISHGMTIKYDNTQPPPSRIADIKVNVVSPNPSQGSGGLQTFCNIFAGSYVPSVSDVWTVEENLASIPDLKKEFENCYQASKPQTFPVEMVQRQITNEEEKDRNNVAEKILIDFDRIPIREFDRYDNPIVALEQISGLSEAYLKPQLTESHVILYKKQGGREIGQYNVNGHKYFSSSHTKTQGPVNPDLLIHFLIVLFSMGHLSRYYPEKWNPFVRTDETGELLLLERFLNICYRQIPNILVNKLSNERIQFVYPATSNVIKIGSE